MCKGEQTGRIKAVPPLTTVKLSIGCSAFEKALIFLSYYQTEEKYKVEDSFISLADVSVSNWGGLQIPLMKEFPKIKAHQLPESLDPVEKINLKQLVDLLKLS